MQTAEVHHVLFVVFHASLLIRPDLIVRLLAFMSKKKIYQNPTKLKEIDSAHETGKVDAGQFDIIAHNKFSVQDVLLIFF